MVLGRERAAGGGLLSLQFRYTLQPTLSGFYLSTSTGRPLSLQFRYTLHPTLAVLPHRSHRFQSPILTSHVQRAICKAML